MNILIGINLSEDYLNKSIDKQPMPEKQLPTQAADMYSAIIKFAPTFKDLKAEVIVVSNFYLGSINHTLLTCSELKQRNIPVTGIIFNGEYNKASADIILKQTRLKHVKKSLLTA